MKTVDLFLDVARRGSFAETARALDIDSSIVSRQIAALEAEIGVRLFERTTRRLALTEAGHLALARLQGPASEMRDIVAAIRDIRDRPSGALRITASVAFAERWLVPRLPSFLSIHPEIVADLVLTDAAVDLVAENIDVGIRLGSTLEGSLVASRLMPTRYAVVASPAYLDRRGVPDRPEDLTGYDCLHFSLPGFSGCWRFRGADRSVREVPISGPLRTGNALALRRAALEGLGIALLADWTVGDDLAIGDLVVLFPGLEATATDFDTAAFVIYPSRAYMPAKVRVFIDYFRSLV